MMKMIVTIMLTMILLRTVARLHGAIDSETIALIDSHIGYKPKQ